MNNTSLHPFSHRFPVIVQYLTHATTRNLASTKPETSFYRTMQKRLDILNRLGVDHKCNGQTDGQTDRTAFRNIAWSNDAH